MIRFHGMQFRSSDAARAFVATDWAATDLGAPDGWPACLKSSVQLCLNSVFPMTLIWGPNHVTIYNDGCLPIMQDKHPNGLGAPVEKVYPELVEEMLPAINAVIERSETIFEEDRLMPLRRRGVLEEVYFTFCYSPVNDELGETRGALLVITDTTDEVLQQRRSIMVSSLAEELSKLRSLDPMSPVIRRALRRRPEDFAAASLLAVAEDGSTTVVWRESATPDDELPANLDVGEHLRRLRRGGKHSSVARLDDRTFALILMDEEVLRGVTYALLVRPAALVRTNASYGKLLRVVLETLVAAAYRILSERQVLQEVTRQRDERERLYGLLFQHSHDGIFISSPAGSVTAANPAACSMLGYSEAEIRRIGRTGILLQDDRSLQQAVAERQHNGTFLGEITFRRKDGSGLTADVSSTLFRDEVTGEERSITLFRDATPRLVSQERMASTARLEAVGALTGGIAHDFNNLLNVIINGAEDLVDRLPEHDASRDAAAMVLAASVRASDLTRQLLAFSRQQPMAPRTVDVSETFRELDQILSRTMGGGIDVQIDMTPHVLALADQTLLQSSVLNLCINARDAMPDGGTLSIATENVVAAGTLAEEARLSAGNYVRISVADTGVGIPRDNLHRILEPFFTTKPEGHGTGLGLSMVYGFVRQSGGGLRIRSESGKGTCVELYLPAAEAGVAPEGAGCAEQTAEVCRAGGGHRILVVEDEELLAMMLRRILEDAGYRVEVCNSGEAALAKLEQEGDYALVITDILLGSGMDGWSLEQQVGERRPSLPVVTMSGFIPQDGAREARRAPTLHKPFRPREVLAVIETRLRSETGLAIGNAGAPGEAG